MGCRGVAAGGGSDAWSQHENVFLCILRRVCVCRQHYGVTLVCGAVGEKQLNPNQELSGSNLSLLKEILSELLTAPLCPPSALEVVNPGNVEPQHRANGYSAGVSLAFPVGKRWEGALTEMESEIAKFSNFPNNTLHAAQRECYVFKDKKIFLIICVHFFFF